MKADSFTITLNGVHFNKKWEILRIGGSGQLGIVIRSIGMKTTIYPYKKYNKKWKQTVWFKWLKLKVWIGDFYKN